MSKNYSMDKIRDKVDKGQFLDDAEKQYLNLEAGNAVDGLIGRWGGRGAGFLLHMATRAQEYPIKAIMARSWRSRSVSGLMASRNAPI